jgi:hypothetical protein
MLRLKQQPIPAILFLAMLSNYKENGESSIEESIHFAIRADNNKDMI